MIHDHYTTSAAAYPETLPEPVLVALARGQSVLPMGVDKKPLVRWKAYQNRQPKPPEVRCWINQFGKQIHGWARVTGAMAKVIVLDDDVGKWLTPLGLQPHVRTKNGAHWFGYHPGWYVKTLNSKSSKEYGRRYPGLDIRGDGGYSLIWSADGRYTWLRDPEPDPLDLLPPEMRQFFGLLTAPRVEAKVLVERALAEASVSGRNNGGIWLAIQFRDNDFSPAEALRFGRDYVDGTGPTNMKGEVEPYTMEIFEKSVGQAFSRQKREPWKMGVSGVPAGRNGSEPGGEELQRDAPRWPDPLADEGFHGLAGELTLAIAPHTEADPIALLSQILIDFGNACGRGPYFIAEGDRHYTNEYAVLVGVSAKGRKGSSAGQVRSIFQLAARDWQAERIAAGLSSGEGLIWAVRDPIERRDPVKEKGRVVDYETIIADPGVDDKRLLVLESEFASTLRVLGRDGNTLSATVRSAWDTGRLQTLTKSSPAKATGAHISIIGHITKEELLRYLDSTEQGNGFGNRFLWLCVRRSNVLPEGSTVPNGTLEPLAEQLAAAIQFAMSVGEMKRDEEARLIWRAVYPALSEGQPGMLGAMIARAEAHVTRLSCLYALLDRSAAIRKEHLAAALAVWEYAEASARFIFGTSLGDPIADELLQSLRRTPAGMTRTDISNLFGRNKSASQIQRALQSLAEHGLVRSEREDTGGGPAERWSAV